MSKKVGIIITGYQEVTIGKKVKSNLKKPVTIHTAAFFFPYLKAISVAISYNLLPGWTYEII